MLTLLGQLHHRLWSTVGPTVLAFLIGALGVVLGTGIGWRLLGPHLGSEGAKVSMQAML